MHVPRLSRENTALLIVDLQERLLPVIHEHERALHRSQVVSETAKRLGLPILLTEQYPKGLGHTAKSLIDMLGDAYRPVEKTAFSACGAEGISEALERSGVENVLIVGIEAHVCVLQTALDLLEGGYRVFPVADAISSRAVENRDLGLGRMAQSGATLVSTEMVVFELLRTAQDPDFRSLQQLIK
ncbi:MAG: hydrolase [Candidatus Poribacteria bacterium]|nr:hydrolase [Candidatus Poribacteria bacterium]